MKALKIVLIVSAVLIVLVVGGVVLLFVVAGSKSANYWEHTQTGGEIEARYTALGSSEVSYAEYDAKDETIGKYAVWYPDDLKSSGNKYMVYFAGGGVSINEETARDDTYNTTEIFKEELSLTSINDFSIVAPDDRYILYFV